MNATNPHDNGPVRVAGYSRGYGSPKFPLEMIGNRPQIGKMILNNSLQTNRLVWDIRLRQYPHVPSLQPLLHLGAVRGRYIKTNQ